MNTRCLLTLLIVAVSAAVSLAQSDRDRSKAVLQALRDYDAAWNKKDRDSVSRMLAPDYVYFSSVGSLVDKEKTLEFLVSPDYKLTFVERSEISIVSTLSKDRSVAIVSTRWKGRGTYGKEPINDDQRCVLVFVTEKNNWKVLSEHCTQIVSK